MMEVLVLGGPLFSFSFFFGAHTFYPKFGCFKPKLHQGFLPSAQNLKGSCHNSAQQ